MKIVNSGFKHGKNCELRDPYVIYPEVIIGDDFSCGHFCIIRESTIIGNSCSIGSSAEIGHHCKIGNNVRIHSSCFIPEFTEIFDNAWIGPRVTILNTVHPCCSNAKICLQKTAVKIFSGAIIGAGCIILPNVTIGHNVFIGAGTLVTKDIGDNCVYYGNPAELKRMHRATLTCKFDESKKPYNQ